MSITERALRHRAKLEGYKLSKSRRGLSLDNFGKYMLIDASTTLIVLGSRFDADLEEVNLFLAKSQLIRNLRKFSTEPEIKSLLSSMGI